jgi:hypothetical protein
MAIGRPRSCASGSGGERSAARRGAAARCGLGAGMLQTTREKYQNVQERTANTTANCGGGEARRRTASRGGGETPAKACRRRGARTSKQTAPAGFLPHGGSVGKIPKGRRVTDDGFQARRPARVRALAAAGTGAARVLGEGPRGARRWLNRGAETPGSMGPAREAGPRRRRRRRGACRVRVGLGREVGDDGWPPPVSHKRRQAHGARAGWAKAARWAGLG